MAAAEARTVWQRTVNRCFVQEDAKRAPKLTYCQSSSSTTSTKQVEDSESSRAVVDPHSQSSSTGFMPLHRNPNVPHLSPQNTRLWSHQHDIQVTKLMETQVNDQVLSEMKLELEAGDEQVLELMETKENYGFIGHDEQSDKRLKEHSFEPSSPWNPLSCEKAGPWWRTTDKDELASLVAQRSLDYVDNCDLPTPQKMKRSCYGSPRCFDSDGLSRTHEHGPSRGGSDKNRTEESNLSKYEILQALRHSQTRAREAENMAKEAYAEKDHLVRLLFKQASELFGYKQLLQLLHLKALYLQIKNKKVENKSKSKETHDSISWSNLKARNPRRKRGSRRRKMNAAVGLALGMSLVGAGLLLGWTVGWMQMLSF